MREHTYITLYDKNTWIKLTLNFKEWANSSLTFYTLEISKFSDGKIDANYIYNKINNRRDIYQQFLLLQKALRPSYHLLGEYTPQEYDGDNNNTH